MSKNDTFVGLLGLAVGVLGIGYAIGTHSKMAEVSRKLDRSIDELASKTPVDIPNDMIERAVEKAVAKQVDKAVEKATDQAISEVKRDIHRQVNNAVEHEYSNIKDAVLREVTEEAANIDAKRVRADVERAAKEHAMKKFDDNLDSILENFGDQLKNTSRIYNSIADTMSGYRSGQAKETVIRLG